jgi:UDP-N-acetylglucosamine:LPS N-acetylglucosamine transferase
MSAMGRAARAVARPDAAERVADTLLELARR